MKSLLIIPLAMLIYIGASASVNPDGKKEKLRTKLELQELFKTNSLEENLGKPNEGGRAIALIEIDSLGNAKILESNSSSPEMLNYLNEKINSKQFINLKNETIKLELDYRK